MKTIVFLFFALTLTLTAFAAPITQKDLVGMWLTQPGFSGPMYVAEITIQADGQYFFRDTSTGGTMPEPGCKGRYEFKSGIFSGTLNCAAVGGPEKITQVVDLRSMKAENMYRDSLVKITSSVMGNQPLDFKFRKITSPYFPREIQGAAACSDGWTRAKACFPTHENGDDEMVSKLYDAISICSKDTTYALAMRAATNTQMVTAKRTVRVGGVQYEIKEPKLTLSMGAGMGPGRGDTRANLYLKSGRKLLQAKYECK